MSDLVHLPQGIVIFTLREYNKSERDNVFGNLCRELLFI